MSAAVSEPTKEMASSRLMIVGLVFGFAFLSLGIRLVDMATRPPLDEPTKEVAQSEEGLSEIELMKKRNAEIDRHRSDIVDRNGNLLAANIVTLSVVAVPDKLIDPQATAVALAGVLDGVDAADLVRSFSRGGQYRFVKRHISPREQMAVQELGLPGIGFDDSEMRVYPKGNLVSHLLGFVNIDNAGLAGIESGLNEALVGGEAAKKPRLELALDLRVQQAMHEELSQAQRSFRPVGACGLVIDVRTRELVSLVSLPDFDPNHPELASANARNNRCVGNVYELGSVFKIVTTAMALESGRVTLADHFDASRPLQIGRYAIRDDHGKWRNLSVPEIFAFSSNIGTAQMAFTAGGAEAQKPFLAALGLSERPDVPMPERQTPIVPQKWADITSATVSYGHGIAVSPLQYAEAVATLVGDGRFARADVLKRPADQPFDGPRVISERTARDIRWLMWLTVERGTGTMAKTAGYLIGGKTGTADKPFAKRRGYQRGAVIASFVGTFPVDDPRYVVMVTLDEPQGNEATYGYRYGGWTAAPVVAAVIERIGPMLGIAPTPAGVESELQHRLRTMPVVNGRTRREEEGFEAVRLAR